MKLRTQYRHSDAHRHGFTLIEIIAVVALIAVFAAVLVPRVAGVIGRGKVSGTAEAIAGLKTATMDYISQNSALPVRAGTGATNGPVAAGRFDADLLAGGFTEKLLTCGIGSQVFDGSILTGRIHVRSVVAIPGGAGAVTTIDGSWYDLDRDPATTDIKSGQIIVSAYIPGVAITDAMALNKIIDGDDNSANGPDATGRCLYTTPDNTSRVTVCVYIAHY